MSAHETQDTRTSTYRRYDFFGSLRTHAVASLATFIAWISATLLFLAFWAGRFTLFQDIVLFVVSLLVLAGVLAGIWMSFGMRFTHRWNDWSD